MKHWTVVACAFLLGGCLRVWLPVAGAMRAKTMQVELSTEDDDYNSKAPPGFTPAKKNKWVLFFYDPAVAVDAHAAFLKLASDCFQLELPPDEDDEAKKPRHAALCAYERTPPPPPDVQL